MDLNVNFENDFINRLAEGEQDTIKREEMKVFLDLCREQKHREQSPSMYELPEADDYVIPMT